MKYKLLLVLFVPVLLKAQTPGYLGRHLTVGYSNNIFISIAGANPRSTDPGINLTHSLNLEYVIKDRTNICFSVQRLRTGLDMDESGYTGYSRAEYSPKSHTPMQLRATNVALGFKFFRRGTFAPVGKYNKFELMLMFSKLNYDKESFRYYNYSSGTHWMSVGKGEYNFTNFAVTYTFGRQRVFFDRLVIDYGLQLGFIPGVLVEQIGSGLDLGSASGYTLEEDFKVASRMRFFTHQLVNFHIGIGFLAF